MSIADDIVPAVMRRFPRDKVSRVVDAWERIRSGVPVQNDWDDRGSQLATSYIADLYTEPWHNVSGYPWIAELERGASVIQDELRTICSTEGAQLEGKWVAAAGDDAEVYGSGWRKLILQDRLWDAAACRLFPKTAEIMKGSEIPSVEVFFTEQQAGSMIKPHTESTNFYLTTHLGLSVPEESCWIDFGKARRARVEGKALVYDPSFVHSIGNDGPTEETLLVVKFWHPEITQAERDALEFIFSVLRDPSILKQPIDQRAENVPSKHTEDQPSPSPAGSESCQPSSDAPLDRDLEAKRLDGFLSSLKAEGLLPGVSTPDQLLASRVPKNRGQRRKAVKQAKRQSSSPRKDRKR